MIGPGRPGSPVSGMLGLDAKATPIADIGHAALLELCGPRSVRLAVERPLGPVVMAHS